MAPVLDPEYSKMLSIQAPLEGSRKDTIDSLQKQIDLHLSEVYRLRTAQNSHVAISRLPEELLSHVFLFIVDSGLPAEHTSFAATTFAFLQVCRRWNEVAIAFPQLWVWWIPGTFKAWHLFKSRSKDAPLFLTWQEYLPESAHTVLMESETPKRIRQLDFSGTTHQFKCILNALDSRSLSTTSSIRLRILRSSDGEHLARFSSFPFPKLSRLDVANFLPDLTSSIFVTSNLTSLKLDIPCPDGRYCTQSQLLQVLQQNRNLRQLNFKAGGLSLAGDSGRLVPALLPHLADLKLSGTTEVIDRFLDLVCMSSPIHRITIHFQRNYAHDTEPLVIIMRKLLTMYYGCKELEPQRKVSHFTAFSDTGSIIAGDHLTHPTYCLRLEFQNNKGELFQKVIPLFPLNYILDFTASGFDLATDAWRGILLRMESLSHLRLERMNTESVLNALGPNDGGQPVSPGLKLLSFDALEFSAETIEKLLEVVGEMDNLDSLAIRCCWVPNVERRGDFEDIVENLVWEFVSEISPEYDEAESDEAGYWEYGSDDYHYPGYSTEDF